MSTNSKDPLNALHRVADLLADWPDEGSVQSIDNSRRLAELRTLINRALADRGDPDLNAANARVSGVARGPNSSVGRGSFTSRLQDRRSRQSSPRKLAAADTSSVSDQDVERGFAFDAEGVICAAFAYGTGIRIVAEGGNRAAYSLRLGDEAHALEQVPEGLLCKSVSLGELILAARRRMIRI